MRIPAILIAPIVAVGVASSVQAAEVGGHYTVAGSNFDGSKYSGTADITVSSNSTCRIAWHTVAQNRMASACA